MILWDIGKLIIAPVAAKFITGGGGTKLLADSARVASGALAKVAERAAPGTMGTVEAAATKATMEVAEHALPKTGLGAVVDTSKKAWNAIPESVREPVKKYWPAAGAVAYGVHEANKPENDGKSHTTGEQVAESMGAGVVGGTLAWKGFWAAPFLFKIPVAIAGWSYGKEAGKYGGYGADKLLQKTGAMEDMTSMQINTTHTKIQDAAKEEMAAQLEFKTALVTIMGAGGQATDEQRAALERLTDRLNNSVKATLVATNQSAKPEDVAALVNGFGDAIIKSNGKIETGHSLVAAATPGMNAGSQDHQRGGKPA